MLSTFLPWLAWLTNKAILADLDKLVIGDSQTNMWNSKGIWFAQLRALMGGDITSVNGFTGTVVLWIDDLTGVPTPDTANTVLVWTGVAFEWNVAPTGDLGIPLAVWRQDSTSDATITGAINSMNVTYELTNTPVSANSVILMYNGLVLERWVTDDYTITGKIITMNFVPVSWKISATYVTQAGTFLGSTLTASEIVGTDGTGGIITLPVDSYPSLPELAFVKGVTSGVQAQLNAFSNSSVATLTNKRITRRVVSVVSSAIPTVNTDSYDMYILTAQAVDITSFTTNFTGSPSEWEMFWIAITGTAARTISWWAKFEASTVALPTTTVSTNRLDIRFIWNSVSSKWRCVSVS